MSRVHWRWSEKDFGFRFKSGGGKSKSDFYQASEPGAFYTVPAKHRKLTKERVDELAAAAPPTSPRVVPIPWQNYEREWDWIESLIAIHPFREGNGRMAFIVSNLLLMQNDLLPLDVYDRRSDEARYYAACEDVRVHRNYQPLATLIAEWQQAAQARWEARDGQ